MGKPRKAKVQPVLAVTPKLWSLDSISNRRVEASGLVVEDFAPRFKRYAGTLKQVTSVLPDSFPGVPKPSEPNETFAHVRWEDGPHHYSLSKQYVSGDAWRRRDASADSWVFDAFDSRYTFDDYLDRRAAA